MAWLSRPELEHEVDRAHHQQGGQEQPGDVQQAAVIAWPGELDLADLGQLFLGDAHGQQLLEQRSVGVLARLGIAFCWSMYSTRMVSLSMIRADTCPAWICSASLLKVSVLLERPVRLEVTTRTTIATISICTSARCALGSNSHVPPRDLSRRKNEVSVRLTLLYDSDP